MFTTDRISSRVVLALAGVGLVLTTIAAEQRAPLKDQAPAGSPTNFVPVSPGPADGQIAFLTARMLEQLDYVKQPFDGAVSSKFLDRYIDTLDPQHMHFTQADLAEFERYRTTLDDLTLTRRQKADTRPGFEIFNRFYERLQERSDYCINALKNEKFTFDKDERATINREQLPHPKDVTEAKKLWMERLRFEYLQELMTKAAAKQKPTKDSKELKAAKDAKDKADGKPPKTEEEEIVETLTNRYVRNLKFFRGFDNEDVLQVYLSSLAHVYDPHSDYLGARQLETFSISMNLSLFGIGAELRSDDGYCTINRLMPGGPAIKSGLIKEKDRIIAVAQSNQPPVDVVDMNLNKAVQLIRGPKGTEVRLTVIPADDSTDRKIVKLIRDEIPLEDQAAKAKIIETTGEAGTPVRLGIIDLPSFYASFDASSSGSRAEPKSTTADVAKLVAKLKQEGVGGIILDIRRNGGGSLEEAVNLTGLFIKQGPVVQVKDSDGGAKSESDSDPSVIWDGPLVVLTSRFSASASEILAGALQDYGRALIVGDSSTHGKGTVQSVNTLKPWMHMLNRSYTNDPGALKVTIKKFYRASGASTQLKGVVPDIVLPSVVSESKDFGESSLDNPMPWDTIASAKYDHLNRVAPYLAQLRKLSSERLSKDREFQYIKEDIEHYKKQQADKSVSLNLKDRLKEKEEADARQKSRDAERLARPESKDKIYEITLKLASERGLPPPMQKTNAVSKASASRSPALSSEEIAALENGADSEADEEPKPPTADPHLIEAQLILKDYLALLTKNNVAWAPNTLSASQKN